MDQTTANQERELGEVAGRLGCEIVQVYKDHGISGAKGRDKRPAFDRLCRDAGPPKLFTLLAPDLEKRILDALKARKTTGDSVRKIAARFGVAASTVQTISRPFCGVSEAA